MAIFPLKKALITIPLQSGAGSQAGMTHHLRFWLSQKCNIFTAEVMSKYKESRRELKINAFISDSLREFSFSSQWKIGTGPAVSVFLDSPMLIEREKKYALALVSGLWLLVSGLFMSKKGAKVKFGGERRIETHHHLRSWHQRCPMLSNGEKDAQALVCGL